MKAGDNESLNMCLPSMKKRIDRLVSGQEAQNLNASTVVNLRARLTSLVASVTAGLAQMAGKNSRVIAIVRSV